MNGESPPRPEDIDYSSAIAKVIEIRECRYGPMLAFADDQVITASLRTYGEWSEHEIDGLSRYIRDDTLVLDVGANIGTHSLAFARRKPGAIVWGFEPQPLVSSLAWTNCARNNARNVTILQMACGDEPSEIVLGPPLAAEANVGAFSLVQPAAQPVELDSALPDPTPPLMRIRVAALDSLPFPLPVSLVKIDVEGMEPAVLAGARRLLARDRPAVFFETLSTENLAAPFALLGGLDYRLFWMETHQFNRGNFRRRKRNLWWRTEMGVLALPHSVEPHADLPGVAGIPASMPYQEDASTGVLVPLPAYHAHLAPAHAVVS